MPGKDASAIRKQSVRVWIEVVALVALVAFVAVWAGRRGAHEERPLAREASWKALDLGMSREAFQRKTAALQQVTLDPPAVVGEGYNPTFPPERPFQPTKGWKTNRPSPSVANPAAPKGGVLRLSMSDYPPTIRTDGPNSRLKSLSDIQILIYEPLLGYDMTLGDYVPGLADHWQVLPDRQTFRFHIDPKAKWSDGRPVTADDVIATFEHLRRSDRKDPEIKDHWDEQLQYVKMLDQQTVEVKSKKPYWRTFLEVSGQLIYPAAYIRMPGDAYLNEWNWKLVPGSGPYELRTDDLVKGQSITVRRRADYWDEDNPERRGTYNFQAVRWEVIRDEELEYQKFLAGELDAYMVMRAQRWMDELDHEPPVQMGWIQRRKIYELEPQGYGGFAFNMRKAPFDDRNVRAAFAHLFNREKLFAKFFFYQYEYTASYFPGQVYARPDAHPARYDPARARALLAAAGWTRRDADGYLVNDAGRRFPELELPNASGPSFERLFQVVVTDLWQQAGIKMNVQRLDSPSLLKKVWDNQFQLVYFNWTASLFPDMEFQFGARYADMPQSNNINGFKNAAADKIFKEYKLEFDARKRLEQMHRLDAILFDQHPYALGWYAPYYRIIWWDKFGYPPEYGDRYTGDLNNVIRYWWVDKVRERATQDNKARGLANYPDRPQHQAEAIDQRYWPKHELPVAASRGASR